MNALDMPPLPPGTRMGGDVVEAVLGAGGFGTVYQVRDSEGDRSALKLVPPDKAIAFPAPGEGWVEEA